jgi:hypothetical protein
MKRNRVSDGRSLGFSPVFRFVTVRLIFMFVKYQTHENFTKHHQDGTSLTTLNRFPRKYGVPLKIRVVSVVLVQVWTEI